MLFYSFKKNLFRFLLQVSIGFAILFIIIVVVSKIRSNDFVYNVKTSMKLLGYYTINNQRSGGDVAYIRDVKTGADIGGFQLVREVAIFYTLSQLYSETYDPKVAASIEKGIAFFSKNSLYEGKDKQFVFYQNHRENNATAFLLLAIIQYSEANPAKKAAYLPQARRLANYLVSTQRADGGFMYTPDKNSEDSFNNGESMYALIRMYKFDPNPVYLTAAQKAGAYVIKKYTSEKFNISFYTWGMHAFSYLYLTTHDQKYWQFMKDYTTKLFAKENFGGRTVDYFNGKNKNYPPGSLSVPLEGLSRVAWIAKDKDPKEYGTLKSFIEKSIAYLLTLQVDGPGSSRTSPFEQVRGGMCDTYSCQTERIDTVQHTLSAEYLYIQYVK